jgi:hypothetical protein
VREHGSIAHQPTANMIIMRAAETRWAKAEQEGAGQAPVATAATV